MFSPGTIIKQLGGQKFIMMTGAKQFVSDSEKQRIFFKIGRNSGGVNMVEIKLNGLDLYDMKFLWVSVKGIKTIKEYGSVYYDQLQSLFTSVTGMYTSL